MLNFFKSKIKKTEINNMHKYDPGLMSDVILYILDTQSVKLWKPIKHEFEKLNKNESINDFEDICLRIGALMN